MIDAVFISDLHLSPDEPAITERFQRFIAWAALNTRAVYILGDFFHVWPGDDAYDAWSSGICERLTRLVAHGVSLYFMHGNRDFLLGDGFAKRSGAQMLTEPALVSLGETPVLLVHGDRYCTNDVGHQWLRRLTRNRMFTKLFLQIPLRLRATLVNKVRQNSQMNRQKPAFQMDVVPASLMRHLQKLHVNIVVHGHTHKPGLTTHTHADNTYLQYVLSDWDDNPLLLCYDKAGGFYFKRLPGDDHAK